MRRLLALLLLLVAGAAIAAVVTDQGADRPGSTQSAARSATAVFAGGCFWCTESDFDHIAGVTETLSGYTGGRVRNPTYAQVSAGNATLVERFFRTIDPLDAGGQFCDRGDQYRSAIFVANAEERRIAEAAKARASAQLGRAVVTEILPRGAFFRAEADHQDYYRRNPIRYRFYRWNCGRDARLDEVWSGAR
jgi:peptide-methionine (S)-S-oxide reductase